MRARADVAIEVPSRTFDVAIPRARHFLLWTRVWVVRRHFVVAGLPLRELLIKDETIRSLARELGHLTLAEACVVILGTKEALRLTDKMARDIWEWWHKANQLALPGHGFPSGGGTSPVLDLVFQLERWPFSFPEERVMSMTAAEACARLEEYARTTARQQAVA